MKPMMARQAEFDTATAEPVAIGETVRHMIENAIDAHLDAAEALILALDELDSDADLEPALGAPEWAGNLFASNADQSNWAAGETDDREEDAGDMAEKIVITAGGVL
ncbi:MAG: hypothetical protein ACLQUZ_15595 [Rhizomicrobium sp.]